MSIKTHLTAHTSRINELKDQIKDILVGDSSNQPVKKIQKQRTKY